MAHADYHCCAICDSKLEYGGYDSTTKERICEVCLLELQLLDLKIVTVDQFIRWVESVDQEVLRSTLKELCFRKCFYDNDVDKTVEERGITFDEQRRVI